MVQLVVYHLFLRSTVHNNLVFINVYLPCGLEQKFPAKRVACFLSQLTMNNENVLYIFYKKHI